jgi:catechol 2,3-dioxygenase-like lactoylglutathione lyase family enzyme
MRIEALELPSSKRDELADFYGRVLGLPTAQEGESLAVTVGASTLRFVPAHQPAFPFHFAFNVPSAQWPEALAWLQARTPLIAGAADERVFHSSNWNADMAYFYDPAGHIGELIARHDPPVPASGAFGAQGLACVSEIGLAVNDVLAAVDQLQAVGVPLYRAEPDADFTPMGDANGLLIVVRAGRLWVPDRIVPATPQPLGVTFRQDGRRIALAASADGSFTLT